MLESCAIQLLLLSSKDKSMVDILYCKNQFLKYKLNKMSNLNTKTQHMIPE